MIKGQRWVWMTGTKHTPAELDAMEVDRADWPATAHTVRPLDAGWPISGLSLSTCRKCRRTYGIDLNALSRATDPLPSAVVTMPWPERVSLSR